MGYVVLVYRRLPIVFWKRDWILLKSSYSIEGIWPIFKRALKDYGEENVWCGESAFITTDLTDRGYKDA